MDRPSSKPRRDTCASSGVGSFAIRAWEQYRGRRLLERGRLADAADALEGTLARDPSQSIVHGADAPAVVALGRVALHTADGRLGRTCQALALQLFDTSAPEVRRQAAWLLMLRAMAGLARPPGPSGQRVGRSDGLRGRRCPPRRARLTNRDVATRMFLSPHMVSMHLRHAFAKLNINSRVELARVVREQEEATV